MEAWLRDSLFLVRIPL